MPACSFESLDPSDIALAISTNSKPLSKTVVRVPQLGAGYEPFLRWAVQDIEHAVASPEPEQMRFATSALMNARRSLSCLTDQYLLRDGFPFCKDRPSQAKDKAQLLVRRGLFDELAARALVRAVERRNRVEHSYEIPDLCDAQDTVQLVRATIEHCVARSDPYWAPVLFGQFLGGHSCGPDGEKHWFQGWSGLLFVLARCGSPPWFGVVVPSSNSKTEAAVRRVCFSELSCDQLLEALAALEARSSEGYRGYGESTFRGQLACLGLVK